MSNNGNGENDELEKIKESFSWRYQMATATMTIKELFACWETAKDPHTCFEKIFFERYKYQTILPPSPPITFDTSKISMVKGLQKMLLGAIEFHKAEIAAIQRDLEVLKKLDY